MRRPDAEAEHFWSSLDTVNGICPWNVFLNAFQRHDQHRLSIPTEQVLSCAIFFENPTGNVTKKVFDEFIDRYGPFRLALEKAAGSLFDSSSNPSPWFHGPADRLHCRDRISKEGLAGSFLIRYSSSATDCFNLIVLTQSSQSSISDSLIRNTGVNGYSQAGSGNQNDCWPNLSAFVEKYRALKVLGLPIVYQRKSFQVTPLVSITPTNNVRETLPIVSQQTQLVASVPIPKMSLKSVPSLKQLPMHAPMSRNLDSDMRYEKLLGEIADLTSKAIDESFLLEDRARHNSKALELLDDLICTTHEGNEKNHLNSQYLCRAFKYEGALLTHTEPQAAMRSYRRAILIYEQLFRRLEDEEMPTDRISAELWVLHLILGKHYLNLGYIEKSIDCYAQSFMYETNQASRRRTAQIWREEYAFNMALKDMEVSKLEGLLEVGKTMVNTAWTFENSNRGPNKHAALLNIYSDIKVQFETALRMARCLIGSESDVNNEIFSLEARALGNLAAINQKRATLVIDDQPMFQDFLSTAASQYKLCIQLFNNLGDMEKEYKILEKLVRVCFTLQRWSSAYDYIEKMLDKAETTAQVEALNVEKAQILEKMSSEEARLEP